jgi:hypothetical protein
MHAPRAEVSNGEGEVDVVPPYRRLRLVERPHHVHNNLLAVALRLGLRGPDLVVILRLLSMAMTRPCPCCGALLVAQPSPARTRRKSHFQQARAWPGQTFGLQI